MPRNPNDAQADQDADAVVTFAYELGVLKRLRRSGWWHVGVRDPESVSEHSLRVAQLASLIAGMEGGDPVRAAYMGMWHDSQEVRIGDIPHSARPYLTVAANEKITDDQVADLPAVVGEPIREAVAEYEAGDTVEARSANDADKLECILQAVEYRESGYHRVQGWIDTCRKAIRTRSGERLAAAALRTSPLAWRDR